MIDPKDHRDHENNNENEPQDEAGASDFEFDDAPSMDDPAYRAFAEESDREETGAEQDNGKSAEDEIHKLRIEVENAKDQMLRAVAESENTRKRLLREREDVRKFAVADFAKDLLDFADNFTRALDSVPQDAQTDPVMKNLVIGIEAMSKDLIKTMERHGIQKIVPMDQPFDPNFHEAMFEAPGTGKAAGTIVEIIEPGYVLNDRLLRPARVGIAKADGGSSAPGSHGGSQGGRIDTEA
jgi:molecular chaperone GrpE